MRIFLENKRTYNLAQGAWKRLFSSLLQEHGYTYTPYINQTQNGKKEYDGNPIFSAFIPEINRAIRIIQVAPDEDGDDISAWIDHIELKGKTKELVLDLKLSKTAKLTAIDVIKAWLADQLDAVALDQLLAGHTS